MLVERVTREDVRSFRLWLQSRFSLSVTSVWHVLSDVRCLFNWCEDAGLVERSPFPRRVMPRLQERPPDRLTDEEAAKLVSLPDPHGLVCRLALGTGLRLGVVQGSGCGREARSGFGHGGGALVRGGVVDQVEAGTASSARAGPS